MIGRRSLRSEVPGVPVSAGKERPLSSLPYRVFGWTVPGPAPSQGAGLRPRPSCRAIPGRVRRGRVACPGLVDRARETLTAEGYGDRVHVRAGDGFRGWPEEAPFDAILVTAAAPRVPEPLLEQLRIGGRLVVPVGEPWQMLEVHERTSDGFETSADLAVRFVPMTGEIREER